MPQEFGLCPVCKTNQLKTYRAARCGACYRARRDIPSVRQPKPGCKYCGKPITRGHTRCVECWYKRVDVKTKKSSLESTVRQPLTTYDEAYKKWSELIGMSRDQFQGPPARTGVEGVTRICVIPDLHIPHHVPEYLSQLIAREADRTDLAVMIGDVSDCQSVSRFIDYPKVPFEVEWAETTAIMHKLAEAFTLRIIAGNHDKRVSRQIAAHLPDANWIDAVKAMSGGVLDPIYSLVRSLPAGSAEIARHPIPGTDLTVDWLTVIGDAVFAHPEVYSRSLQASRKFDEMLHDHGEAMGVDYAALRLIVMGHTHNMSLVPWRSSSTKLLVECGCLCQTAAYMTTPRISGSRPQRRGYVTLTQVDGRTDLNSVRLHFLDLED